MGGRSETPPLRGDTIAGGFPLCPGPAHVPDGPSARGAGLTIEVPPPRISNTASVRSLVPSGRNRKVPSIPAKPEGLVSVVSAKRCDPYCRLSAAARDTAS